jgi:hypothetical protein
MSGMVKAVFVLVLLTPQLVVAQAPGARTTGDVRREARGHLGPFYVTPTVLLKEIGVDGNVFNEAGEQKSDFTITLSPKLDVWVPMASRALLQTTVAPDLVWYARYDTERSVNPHVKARGEVYLTRVVLFGESGYLHTRQRPNYEVDARSRRVEDSARAGIEVALSPTTTVELAGRQVALRHDSDAVFDGTSLARALNRDTRGLQLTARHRLTPLTTLAMRYDVRQDRFVLQPTRDSDSYQAMPGIEFAPQALLKGTAYIGYRRFTPSVAELLPAFSGVVGEVGLAYTLRGSTTLGTSYRRDLAYSYSELQPFFVDNAIGVTVRRALGRRFDMLLSGDRHEYHYQNALTAGADAGRRRDLTHAYAMSLGYRIGHEGRLGFGVSYAERESTERRRRYTNLRVGSSFSYGF